MNKSIKITGVVILFLLLAVAVAGTVYYRSLINSNTTTIENAQQVPATDNPAVIGQLQSFAVNSITLKLQDSSTKTFSVSTTTKVITQVTSGQTGKRLAEIAPGTTILVQPHELNSTVADMVSVVPLSAVSAQDPAGPPVFVSGILVSVTDNSVVLNTTQDPALRVSITKDTDILSNVLAGERGKTLKEATAGMYVQVSGVATSKGLVAKSIQLLVPLGQ
jgi:hypothetical protein